jgi:acetyl esterase/lipase
MAAEIEIRHDVEYACHDGVVLLGDLYAPAAPGTYPTLLLIHGGAWQGGSRARFRYWGPYLAEHGYTAFAVTYRLSTPEQPSYPLNVYDVKAAVQFLRGKGAALKVASDRIGAMGASAGGHLTALLALSGDSPKYPPRYPDDPYPTASTRISAAVPFYGVYDLMAQWEHDQLHRPHDQFTEKYLGGPPMAVRDLFYEASPINWATFDNAHAAFLVIWGMEDDVVDAETQAVAFVRALKRANIYAHTIPIAAAPHYWIEEPLDDPTSYTNFVAPRILRFLAEHL